MDQATPATKASPSLGSMAVGGIAELLEGLRHWRLCHMMGLAEIRRRYARSRVGQFWFTISTGVLVLGLGVVWAALWRTQVSDLLPFLATSLVLWLCLSGAIGEATTVLAASGPLFLNQGMSFATAVLGLVYRHLIILAHNVPIILLTMLAFPPTLGPASLLVVPGLVCLVLSLVWLCYVVALVCVRFRDLVHLVQNGLTMAFFVTPVLWKPEQLPPDAALWMRFNPFAALIAVVREPLLGKVPTVWDWLGAVVVAVGGFALALPLIGYSRRRAIYWI